ncbi:unnamed protein product [Paramecium primaurelia]|uniref:Uncharacterized protein n=1 Tax=Paramecium primaurelia TaxID=5886 RepID=A0A8S1NSN2_PARPR|nr:unnamed protein product [Paramecium primaurelia]
MIQERHLRSNEKVDRQLDYQTMKMISPQADVNFKKENSNPLDQNCSAYLLKGYERQAPYKSNQIDQNRQTGEPLKMASNNNPYLKQSVNNNHEQEQTKPFIRAYQEGEQRKPLDQVNYKQEQRLLNQREITSPYGNFDNKKRDPIDTRTPFDPNTNMSAYTPQSRQDNYRKDVQQSEQKREFQLPEYKRMYPDQDPRIPQRQMSAFEMKQKPFDQGDKARYDQERIRTLGGQQEQPERMDRLIRASDYTRKSDNNDFLEQDKRVLERREFNQRGGADQVYSDQRNTAKSQEYSQRQQIQLTRPQEGSKTPIEGRINEKRGYDDQMQQEGRFNQSQFTNPYLQGRTQQQQFYDMKPPLDDQRRMLNPYDERRNVNPYETRPQIQDQRSPFQNRPDRVEIERRLEHPEFERRPDVQNKSPYQARFGPEGKSEVDQRLPPQDRQLQGQNYERYQQSGYRQGMDGKYQYEVRQPQQTQFQEIPVNGPRLQEVRQGMNYRKYSDGRSIQDGQMEFRDGQEGKHRLIEGRSGLPEGRPELNEARPGFEGRFGLTEGRPGFPEGKPGFERRREFEGRPGFPEGRLGFEGRPGYPEGRPGFPEGRPGFPEGRPGFPEGRHGFPEGRPGFPEGRLGLPEGRPGLPEGRPGFPEGRPGFPEGRPGFPEGRLGLPEGRLGLPEGRPGQMDGIQQQVDGRGGFNRTCGEDRYQGTPILDGRTGFNGRREQFGTRPPIQSRPFEERGTFEQRAPIENRNQYQRGFDDQFGDRQFEQKYSQQQDIIGRKDLGRPEYGKVREEINRRNAYGRQEMEDNLSEFGKRKEFDGRIRPETSFGKPYQPEERYLRREYNDQGQRLSYHEDTSVIDRLGLERGTNRKIIGNQAAENMLRGEQQMNRQYDRERGFNRIGMGERVASFTNSKMGYQRTAVQDREEYQGYVRSKQLLKPSLGNDQNDFQKMKSQDQGFQKLLSPKGQIETKVGIYDIQRRDGRI